MVVKWESWMAETMGTHSAVSWVGSLERYLVVWMASLRAAEKGGQRAVPSASDLAERKVCCLVVLLAGMMGDSWVALTVELTVVKMAADSAK